MNKIISRKKSRKFLFQKLFSDTYNKNDNELFNNSFIIDSFKWNLDENYLSEMEKTIKEKQPELLELLKMYAPKFSPEKMDLTYVIPIFIWATEMLYFSEEIPPKVSINEAIEISKLYWTDSSPKIVNWVLNSLYKNYEETKSNLKNIKDKVNSEGIDSTLEYKSKSNFSFFIK